MRGLDYYNLTVFEWVSTALGAQGTVCGGGRYDGLVEELGGPAIPAVGFGLGMERLILLLKSLGCVDAKPQVDVYVLGMGHDIERHLALTAQFLRDQIPGLRVMTHCGGGAFKRQFKRADRLNAKLAVIIGDNEIANNSVTIKDLKDEGIGQQEYGRDEAVARIRELLGL